MVLQFGFYFMQIIPFFLLTQPYRGVVIELSFVRVKQSIDRYVCERKSVIDDVFYQEIPTESDIIYGKRG